MRTLATMMVLVLTHGVPAADPPKLAAKVAKTEVPEAVAKDVAAELDANAVVVSDADGEAVLTVWFRTAVPVKATADQVRNGLTYREIPDGTLVGVIQFARPFTDFRKQDIPAGAYTVRFAVQPDTGDHMGTAPHPEFVLLTPAAKDEDPAPVEVKKLVERSSTITDGDHPGVMLLFPNFDKADGPTIAAKDGKIAVLQVRRPVEADGAKTTLGFALVVAGHSATR